MLDTKWLKAIYAIVFMQYCFIKSGKLFAAALLMDEDKQRMKHPNDIVVQNNRPSNILTMNEYTTELPEEHLHPYYLPEQTMFGSIHMDLSSSVLLTSPPRLSISPSSVQEDYLSTHISSEYSHPAKDDAFESTSTQQKQYNCISQTPTLDLMSESLFPSEALKEDIMSGRAETASKTETDEESAGYIISHPSVAVQGTKVNIRRNPSAPVILSI